MTLTLDIDGRRVARHSKTINNKSVNETVELYASGAITIEQADERAMSWIYAKAARVAKTQGIPTQELLGAAWSGWRDALRRFEPRDGCTFTTYANTRIYGAIHDYQRKMLPISRRHVEISKKIDKAYAHLSVKLGRQPTDQEIAEESGISTEQQKATRDAVKKSLQIAVGIGDDGEEERHSRHDGLLSGGYVQSHDGRYRADWHHVHDLESQEIIDLINYECSEVHCFATKAIRLRFEGYSMKQIGEECGFSETRASQILRKCRDKMMQILPDYGIDMSPERFIMRMQGPQRSSREKRRP